MLYILARKSLSVKGVFKLETLNKKNEKRALWRAKEGMQSQGPGAGISLACWEDGASNTYSEAFSPDGGEGEVKKVS